MGLAEDLADQEHQAESLLTAIAASAGDVAPQLAEALQQAFPKAQAKAPDAPSQQSVLLQQAVRRLGLQLVKEAAAAGSPPMSYRPAEAQGGPLVPRLLEVAVYLVQRGTVEGSTLTMLLEDIMEGSVLADNAPLVSWMEQYLPPMVQSNQVTSISVLRLGNRLVKRLSKSVDSGTVARLLMFFAKIYPVHERSGVNVTGAVNEECPRPVPEQLEGEALDSTGQPVDVALYRDFWSLQEHLQDYRKLMVGPKQERTWSEFKQRLLAVLGAFDRIEVNVPAGIYTAAPPAGHNSSNSSSAKATAAAAAAAAAATTSMLANGVSSSSNGGHGSSSSSSSSPDQTQVVNYLTSHTLFNLQMSDGLFRRAFLVQVLICLQSVTVSAKSVDVGFPQKAEASDLSAAVLKRLGEVGRKGRTFVASVVRHLKEEELWIKWKATKAYPGYYLTQEEATEAANLQKDSSSALSKSQSAAPTPKPSPLKSNSRLGGQQQPPTAAAADAGKDTAAGGATKQQQVQLKPSVTVCDWTRPALKGFSVAAEVVRLAGQKRQQREEDAALVQQVLDKRRQEHQRMLTYDFEEPPAKRVETLPADCSTRVAVLGSELVPWLQQQQQQHHQQQQQQQAAPGSGPKQQQQQAAHSSAALNKQQQQQVAAADVLALRVAEREGWPTLEVLAEKALQDLDPSAGIEYPYRRLLSSTLYRWQLAHLMAQSPPPP